MNFIDLTGKVFGRLTAEYPVKDGRRIRWICSCSCGTKEHSVISDNLTRGQVSSCGCAIREIGKNHFNARWVGEVSLGHICSIKQQAKSREIAFEVSDEYIADLLATQDFKCALTGLPIASSNKPKTRTASLDRIDSSKGYTEGNLQWVHKVINRMKLHYSQELFIQMCALVTKHQETKCTF